MVEARAVNARIVDLWNRHFGSDENAYAPLFYNDFNQGGLLFIGVNPSFSVEGLKRIVSGTDLEGIDPVEFMKWKNISDRSSGIADCVSIDTRAAEIYPYFKQMRDISKTIGMPFQHADCFLYRCTSQKDFLSMILEKNKLNEFAKEQLSILGEIIETIRPQTILVANAFASKTLREYFKDSLTFDNERGHHMLLLHGRSAPIFFSSMLTGQRALDTGSRERLIWHLGRCR